MITKLNQLHCLHLVLLTGSVICVSGCGGPYDAAVSGVVTLDGVAVPRGNVTFYPVQGGPTAYARIEENGDYVARTGREEGLPSGDYQVIVSANEPAPGEQPATAGPPPVGKPITPVWYRSRQTSGLQFTVEPGSNRIEIELSSTPPPGWQTRGRR